MQTISILTLVFALVATILAFIFIVPVKRRNKLNALGKTVHDVLNFKFLFIEKVLQALYIFATAAVFFYGFFLLFYVQRGYSYYGFYPSSSQWFGGYGLLIMLLGPIVVRIIFEASMMFILLIKNVIQINNKLKSENNNAEDVFAAPIASTFNQQAYAAPANNVCPHCGYAIEPGSTFCPYCGQRTQ